MSGRIVELVVALAVAASAFILAAMLAAPWLSTGAAPPSSAVPTATGVATSPPARSPLTPPVGSFQLGGPLNFGRVCLGIELEPVAYPVAAGGEGVATVYWWESSIVDPGHPAACASRAGDLHTTEAVVRPIPDDGDPEAPPTGYTLLFHLPSAAGGELDMEIALLTSRSTSDRIQALDLTTSGSGLVFERVTEIDPPFVPAPSQAPAAVAWPDGLFLLRGPFEPGGPCIFLELAPPADLVDPGAEGVAALRWWQPGGSDPTDPTFCLSRSGEVSVGPASIAANRSGPEGQVESFAIGFTLPGAQGEAARTIGLQVPMDATNPDQLTALVTTSDSPQPLFLVSDRVDSIDPPLVTP